MLFKNIQKFLHIHKTCFKVRKYLKNGIYYYHKQTVQKSKKSLVIIVVFSFKKKNTFNKFQITDGKWSKKTILNFGNEYCYIYHLKNSKYQELIRKIQKFNYPKLKIHDINRKFYFAKKVEGDFGVKSEYLQSILKSLLENCKKRVTGNCTNKLFGDLNFLKYSCYLQHGDVGNGFWNGEKYVLIDLDTVDYRPPLYDILDLLLRSSKYFGVLNCEAFYNSDYLDNDIKNLFNIDSNEIAFFKDVCLKSYLIRRLNLFYDCIYGYQKWPSEYAWINYEFLKNFPETLTYLYNWQKSNNFIFISDLINNR